MFNFLLILIFFLFYFFTKKNNDGLSPNPALFQTLTSTPWTPLDSEYDSNRHSSINLHLQSSLQKVLFSKFYGHFISQLHSPKIQSFLSSFHKIQLIIYGIGNIESIESARVQLSLAVLLRRELGAKISSVELFDPLLSATECTVLEELGFPVMRFDENCRRKVKVPTLFFMPHCPCKLYENLLSANWGDGDGYGMRMMAILGNSFDGYRKYVEAGVDVAAKIEEEGQRVIWVSQFTREVEMEGLEEEEFEILVSFHNMSWHFF